jgi:hypothetical protein
MIRILSYYYHLDPVKIALIEGTKYLLTRRKDSVLTVFCLYKSRKLLKVRLIKLFTEPFLPRRSNVNIHTYATIFWLMGFNISRKGSKIEKIDIFDRNGN